MKNEMEDEAKWWVAPFGAVIVFSMFASIGLIAFGGWNWFAAFLAGQAASWFQAFGSVAAILAAYRMGANQILANRVLDVSRNAREDRRKLIVIDAILKNLEFNFEYIKDFLENYRIPVNSFGRLGYVEDAVAAVKRIDLFDCPSPEVISLLALLPRQCDRLLEEIKNYDKSFDTLEGDIQKAYVILSNGMGASNSLVSTIRQKCQLEISRLGKLE